MNSLCAGDGSSPRRRGTPDLEVEQRLLARFIPAQAGNTVSTTADTGGRAVHPRAGGEHGENRRRHAEGVGSSPRRRGTPWRRGAHLRPLRFIPAQAGNTVVTSLASQYPAVHPRAGGEHYHLQWAFYFDGGSSPRRRGTHHRRGIADTQGRFIPAQAGNTEEEAGALGATPVHPRAGGEHLSSPATTLCHGGSSPRRRGTRREARCSGTR